jgi:hypothetical protein
MQETDQTVDQFLITRSRRLFGSGSAGGRDIVFGSVVTFSTSVALWESIFSLWLFSLGMCGVIHHGNSQHIDHYIEVGLLLFIGHG